jgi:hypothetical protein
MVVKDWDGMEMPTSITKTSRAHWAVEKVVDWIASPAKGAFHLFDDT